jgi:N-acetylmuramoyl-L-alanine amidase
MKILIFLTLFIITAISVVFILQNNKSPYGAPPYSEEDFRETPIYPRGIEKFGDLRNWKRPDGPMRVGLQVGHLKNSELPDELENLRGNSGASNRGVAEWEVTMEIALITQKLLEEEGYVVDILPATVPVAYVADAFVALHADGSTSSQTEGFKVAAPRRDYTGKSSELATLLESQYKSQVGFPIDLNITRNMTGYYAFSWWRYDHSIHPMTPAVILETGFLTNPTEARLLINNPELPALAIVDGVTEFLNLQSK